MAQDALIEQLAAREEEAAVDWLRRSCELRGERLLAAFVGAGRRFAHQPMGDGATLSYDKGELRCGHWSGALAARVALLLSVRQWPSEEASAWIQRCYREGDTREKSAVVAALPLLPFDESLLELALDAGRTNEADFFRLLSAHNPFPAEHYDELSFNKLVMKAAFSNHDIAAIEGLAQRHNPELARMAMEYIDERQSAGRAFPPSLWLAIAPDHPPGSIARMLGELQHSVADRRRGAAQGLGLAGDPRALPFLRERLSMENDSACKARIEAALHQLEEQS